MEYKDAVSFKTCLLASMCLKLGLNLQILYRVIPPSILSRSSSLGIGLYRRAIHLIIGIVLARIIDGLSKLLPKERRQVNPGKQSFTGN
jgi:hypothetical protein